MKQDLEIIFAGLEQYVEVVADNEIYVFDFLGFTSDWDEIMQDIPDFVREKISFCKAMFGTKVDWASWDI